MCCYQCVKDKNFESNSQLDHADRDTALGCYQCVKDKNFESNSQPVIAPAAGSKVVISVSKIKISKAIHNTKGGYSPIGSVVISVSQC